MLAGKRAMLSAVVHFPACAMVHRLRLLRRRPCGRRRHMQVDSFCHAGIGYHHFVRCCARRRSALFSRRRRCGARTQLRALLGHRAAPAACGLDRSEFEFRAFPGHAAENSSLHAVREVAAKRVHGRAARSPAACAAARRGAPALQSARVPQDGRRRQAPLAGERVWRAGRVHAFWHLLHDARRAVPRRGQRGEPRARARCGAERFGLHALYARRGYRPPPTAAPILTRAARVAFCRSSWRATHSRCSNGRV